MASGTNSTLIGGSENTASGSYSVAIGKGALASNYGEFTHASGIFSSVGDAQSSWLIYRGTTTDATTTTIYLDGTSATASLPNDSSWFMVCHFVARRTDANDESAGGKIECVIDKNSLIGSTSLAGTTNIVYAHRDDTNWSIDIIANTSYGGPEIRVTGASGKTINWVVYANVVQVIG